MAAFVMKVLGCEVAALNTVHYSTAAHFRSSSVITKLLQDHDTCADLTATDRHAGNHLGYRQTKGTQTSPEELTELYAGLKQSYLTDFDVMLTGYAPNAQSVDAIGAIGRDLKLKASTKTGSFFWGACHVTGLAGE